MRTITEIYKEYNIFPILEMHMLRVAAVAGMICDSFDQKLDKDIIVSACILHDMGNLVKTDFEFNREYFEIKGLDYWRGLKEEFIRKYGVTDHEANINIAKELGLSPEVIRLIDKDQFGLLCEHRESNDMALKIVHYADMRSAPYGILSYEDRMAEAKIRYPLKTKAEEKKRETLIICGKDIEKQIFTHCKIKPEEINDQSVASIIEELRGFVIK